VKISSSPILTPLLVSQTPGKPPQTTTNLLRDLLKMIKLAKSRKLPEDSLRRNVLTRKTTCPLTAVAMRNSSRVKKISRGLQSNSVSVLEPLTAKASSHKTRHNRRHLICRQTSSDSLQPPLRICKTCLYRNYRSVSVIFQTILLLIVQTQQRAAIQMNLLMVNLILTNQLGLPG